MRLYKTGHSIADTVSDLIGELPDGEYRIGYGILRGSEVFLRGSHSGSWFEIDKGFWSSGHYGGFYRLSYKGTQPVYSQSGPTESHGQTLDPWRDIGEWTMICPPTGHVCDFFSIDYSSWLFDALHTCKQFPETYMIRTKDAVNPIEWGNVRRVITFNSTIGFEALRRGIPVISDQEHSTIGSYTSSIGVTSNYDRDRLFSFCAGHQFKLDEKPKILSIIKHYLERANDPERLDRPR